MLGLIIGPCIIIGADHRTDSLFYRCGFWASRVSKVTDGSYQASICETNILRHVHPRASGTHRTSRAQ